MLSFSYDYSTCVRNAEKICWTVDQVIPPGTSLDLSRPFLPEALWCGAKVPGLSANELLKLNQITGNAYMNVFGFVEEYIVATVVKHAEAEMHGDHDALRALIRFAEEELKHQQLFNRFIKLFRESFGYPCGVLGDAALVAGIIMSKSPITVLLMTLHIEIMTQSHYTESVRSDTRLDPTFVSMLKHHWLEEAQHAKIAALELEKLVNDAPQEMIDSAIDQYLELIGAFDGLLLKQAEMDLDSLTNVAGRELSEAERAAVVSAQHKAYRNTFLVLGMRNPTFADILKQLSPAGAARVVETAKTLIG